MRIFKLISKFKSHKIKKTLKIKKILKIIKIPKILYFFPEVNVPLPHTLQPLTRLQTDPTVCMMVLEYFEQQFPLQSLDHTLELMEKLYNLFDKCPGKQMTVATEEWYDKLAEVSTRSCQEH